MLNAGYLLKQHYIRYFSYNNCDIWSHSSQWAACVLIDNCVIFNFSQLAFLQLKFDFSLRMYKRHLTACSPVIDDLVSMN